MFITETRCLADFFTDYAGNCRKVTSYANVYVLLTRKDRIEHDVLPIRTMPVKIAKLITRIPVPNLAKSCDRSHVAFSSWCRRQASVDTFLSFSEFTAFTSRSVALSVNSGLRKNCANLIPNLNKLAFCTQFVNYASSSKLINAL